MADARKDRSSRADRFLWSDSDVTDVKSAQEPEEDEEDEDDENGK